MSKFSIVVDPQNLKYGRFMVADRFFEPGEVILRDSPIVYGPWNSASCLTCLSKLETTDLHFKCEHCGFGFCSRECFVTSDWHPRECGFLKELSGQGQLKLKAVALQYQLVSLLRLILELMHNLATGSLNAQCLTWKCLIRMFQGMEPKLSNDQNLYHLLCIRKTNAKAIRGLGQNCEGFAIYPNFSLINHRCENFNTSIEISPSDFALTLRARTKIEKGNEITTTYLSHGDPTDEGQPSRRLKIWRSWRFICRCSLCENPFKSGVTCPKCNNSNNQRRQQQKQGLVSHAFPVDPCVPGSPWVCEGCGHVQSEADVVALIQDFEISGDRVEDFANFFHPDHFLRKTL
ncbi:histone-lysine N-methyltransferase SMYD3-like isoform X2 [Tigriopus californicus]|uniref:histone-lysine N-methyltransferase SMYD3-like isoform X2 n=1 Tax=Tigriopus californicus TaxID=6832 RepID=UPI0027DA2E9C|nr:histone-lysine N-methyltransferase SMYD3-like isoform X2 [Tigriopus californicus]